jgi:hypothetical protein
MKMEFRALKRNPLSRKFKWLMLRKITPETPRFPGMIQIPSTLAVYQGRKYHFPSDWTTR